MTKRCASCGQFVSDNKVHGCKKQAKVVKTTITFIVPREAFNPLAAAFARAGLVSLHASA